MDCKFCSEGGNDQRIVEKLRELWILFFRIRQTNAMEFFLNFFLLFSWVEQMLNLEFEKEIFSHDMTVYFIFVYSK